MIGGGQAVSSIANVLPLAGRIILIGDSNAVPQGGGTAAIDQLTLGANVDIVKNAVSGRTLSVTVTSIVADASLLAPYIDATKSITLIVQLGTNDLYDVGGAALVNGSLIPLVTWAHEHGMRIVVATVPARGDTYWTAAREQNRLDYNQLVRANAFGHDGLIDIARTAPIADGVNTGDPLIYVDRLHYTALVQSALVPVYVAAVRDHMLLKPRPTAFPSIVFTTAPTFADHKLAGGRGRIPAAVVPAVPTLPMTIEFDLIGTTAGLNVIMAQAGGWYLGVDTGRIGGARNAGQGYGGFTGTTRVTTGSRIRVELSDAGMRVFVNDVQEALVTGKPVINARMTLGDLDGGGSYAFNYGRIGNLKIYSGLKSAGTAARIAYYPLVRDATGSA